MRLLLLFSRAPSPPPSYAEETTEASEENNYSLRNSYNCRLSQSISRHTHDHIQTVSSGNKTSLHAQQESASLIFFPAQNKNSQLWGRKQRRCIVWNLVQKKYKISIIRARLMRNIFCPSCFIYLLAIWCVFPRFARNKSCQKNRRGHETLPLVEKALVCVKTLLHQHPTTLPFTLLWSCYNLVLFFLPQPFSFSASSRTVAMRGTKKLLLKVVVAAGIINYAVKRWETKTL